MQIIKIAFVSIFLSSCAGTPPLKEYSLARTALFHAKKFEANKYQPQTYERSRYFYRQGKKSFNERFYSEARDFFEQSIKNAERAENITRWKKYKKGDYSL